ncbi:pentapeptide repeat-containing protein [Paracoccus sp. SY]|uniref:pentapeptide repeat-containing protein n=1 Tax=Paracoccus sp. SY TaxID=1330255 RepID=UPI001304C8E4|nr:pentapeptide repeat-containing protein [Paracoccus sp. SY]
MTDWLGITHAPNWNVARPIGPLMSVVVAILFILALVSAASLLVRTIFSQGEPTLSTGALITAILGSPFLIWGTVLKHRTVLFQKEGHMTDRINKAVEQLGTAKSVEKIGRSVTIWTGGSDRVSCTNSVLSSYVNNARTKIVGKDWRETYNERTDEVTEEYWYTVATWQEERTVVQWLGDTLKLNIGETIGAEGEWQVFKETVPNIEVRIGAILSLERIAQDSARHDHGRDHVRVMEILCGYIRENAPASVESFSDYPTDCNEDSLDKKMNTTPYEWVLSLNRPRSDIQLALTVIGRRSESQIEIERSHVDGKRKGYRLDLSNTCLRRADIEGSNFAHASFYKSLLEGAYCKGADFSHSNFVYAKLTMASAAGVDFSSAKLELADLSYANLTKCRFFANKFSHTHFVRSILSDSEIQFAPNVGRSEVNRAFFVRSNLKGATLSGDLLGITLVVEHGEKNRDYAHIRGLRFKVASLAGEFSFLGHTSFFDIFPRDLLQYTFGDASVNLPKGVLAPHWPSTALTESAYEAAYSNWLSSLHIDAPPVLQNA